MGRKTGDHIVTSAPGSVQDESDASGYTDMWRDLTQKFDNNPEFLTLNEVHDRESLEALIRKVRDEYSEFQDAGGSKARRVGKKVQVVCAAVSRLLENYSGIAEIIKGIDSRGGPLAYGTLSIIVSIARHKQLHEERITSNLLQISDWLEDLRDYQNIWHEGENQVLTRLAIEVHRHMLHFVLGVWNYYSGSRASRIWQAMRNSSKHSLEVELQNLRSAIKRALGETRKLHHKENREMARRIEDLERQNITLINKEWTDSLSNIRNQLACTSPINVESYARDLRLDRIALAADDGSVSTEGHDSLESLNQCKDFNEWALCDKSCMILLRAIHGDGSNVSRPLWLSPALADYASSLPEQGGKKLFYAVQKTSEKPASILSHIICEILSWDRSFFDQQKQIVHHTLASIDLRSDNFDALLDLFSRLAKSWYVQHPGDTFYIIVDRLDGFLQKDHSGVALRQVFQLLEEVLQLMHSVNGVIKACFLVQAGVWHENPGLHWQLNNAVNKNSTQYFKDPGLWIQTDPSD